MEQTMHKAIAALLTAAVGLFAEFGVDLPITDGYALAIATVLTPFLVWLVPNRAK